MIPESYRYNLSNTQESPSTLDATLFQWAHEKKHVSSSDHIIQLFGEWKDYDRRIRTSARMRNPRDLLSILPATRMHHVTWTRLKMMENGYHWRSWSAVIRWKREGYHWTLRVKLSGFTGFRRGPFILAYGKRNGVPSARIIVIMGGPLLIKGSRQGYIWDQRVSIWLLQLGMRHDNLNGETWWFEEKRRGWWYCMAIRIGRGKTQLATFYVYAAVRVHQSFHTLSVSGSCLNFCDWIHHIAWHPPYVMELRITMLYDIWITKNRYDQAHQILRNQGTVLDENNFHVGMATSFEWWILATYVISWMIQEVLPLYNEQQWATTMSHLEIDIIESVPLFNESCSCTCPKMKSLHYTCLATRITWLLFWDDDRHLVVYNGGCL